MWLNIFLLTIGVYFILEGRSSINKYRDLGKAGLSWDTLLGYIKFWLGAGGLPLLMWIMVLCYPEEKQTYAILSAIVLLGGVALMTFADRKQSVETSTKVLKASPFQIAGMILALIGLFSFIGMAMNS